VEKTYWWWSIVAALALLASACGEQVCDPGKQRSCPCPDSAETGVQTCNDEGSGWSSCSCWPGGDVREPGDTGDTGGPSDETDGGSDDQGEVDWGETAKLDLLWVIDNSGSMCEEQEALRQNFRNFLSNLTDVAVDFNIAVTTTNYQTPYEVVAPDGEWGHIQSTPHPPVGFDANCQKDERDADVYKKLRTQIEAAVACTKNPEQYSHLTNLSDDQIKCALEGNEAQDACSNAGWSPDEVGPALLFPCGDKHGARCDSRQQFEEVYRDLPKVLSAADYTDDNGTLSFEELQQDFACMSYVGTRGDSTEQGLKAAVEAVAPENTGGTVENPLDAHGGTSAPNHGWLRSEAVTGVVFVTDENDCSHPDDVDLFDRFGCGEMGCYYPTMPGRDNQDPLFSTQQLAEEFLQNLADSRDTAVEAVQDRVVLGSIHGSYQPYGTRDDQKLVKNCGSDQRSLRQRARVCQNSILGSATSGDRYEDFLRHFNHIFPARNSGGEHLTGWMCQGNLGRAMSELAKTLRPGN